MSTTVIVPEAVRTPSSQSAVPARPSFFGIPRGEWIKLLSLRSTWWILAATVVLITGISLAVAYSLDAIAADPVKAPGSPR
jgi:ABC-2 type transport system permease protein